MTLRGRLGSTRKTKRGLGCNTVFFTNSEGIIEGTINRTVHVEHVTVSTAHDAYGYVSDLSPFPLFAGQRSNTDERLGLGILGCRHIELGRSPYGDRKFGNPCAEKVSAHRSRQLFFRGAGRPASNAKLPQFGGIVVVANPLL